MVSLVHATDRIICVDGCTDETAHSESATVPAQDAPSPCLLCHSSIIAGPEIPAATTLNHEPAPEALPLTGIPDHLAPDIDHPPRFS